MKYLLKTNLKKPKRKNDSQHHRTRSRSNHHSNLTPHPKSKSDNLLTPSERERKGDGLQISTNQKTIKSQISRKSMEINIVLEPQEEGGYTIYIPSLPGCISQGETKEEAIENIKEAMALWLEPDPNEILVFKDNFETERIIV